MAVPLLVLGPLSDNTERSRHVLDSLRDAVGEDDLRLAECVLTGLTFVMQRRYEEADSVLTDYFRPEPAFHFDKTAILHLWMSHFLQRAPAPEIVDYTKGITLADTPFALSAQVALAMSTSSSLSEAGRLIVRAGDKMLSGRLELEESEFLVALARLAQLEGDARRARSLAEGVAPRGPWTCVMLAEVLSAVDGWSDGDWSQRARAEVLARVAPGRLAELRERGPRELAEELDRWRSVT